MRFNISQEYDELAIIHADLYLGFGMAETWGDWWYKLKGVAD